MPTANNFKTPPNWWELPEIRSILDQSAGGQQLQNTVAPDMGGMPGIQNQMGGQKFGTGMSTGLGPDGVLQPDNPTSIESIAKHEGEFVVDAEKTEEAGGPSGVNAAVQQQIMKKRETNEGIRGYVHGGLIEKTTSGLQKFGEKIKTSIEEAKEPTIPTEKKAELPSTSYEVKPTDGIKSITAPPDLPKKDFPTTEFEVKPDEPVVTDEGAVEGGTMEDVFRTQGMVGLSKIASGDSEAFRKIANMALTTQSAAAAADFSSFKQSIAQMPSMGGSAGATALAGQRIAMEASRSALAGELAKNAQIQAMGASEKLASQALSGMRLDFDKEKFKDVQKWDAYDKAVLAGDYDTAAEKYKEITGNELDVTMLDDYKDYLKTKRNRDMAGEDYTTKYGQYEDAVARGDFKQARAIWGEMAKNSAFAPWLPSTEPDWDTMEDEYAEGEINDAGDLINTIITQSEGLGKDNIELQLHDPMERYLEGLYGRPPTEAEIATEFENRWIVGTETTAQKAIRQLENNPIYATYFDTPEERAIVARSMTDLIRNGGITYNPDTGEIVTDPVKILDAWDNPEYAHIFALTGKDKDGNNTFEPGWDQAKFDGRETYLDSTAKDELSALDKWEEWWDAGADGDPPVKEKKVEVVDVAEAKIGDTILFEGANVVVSNMLKLGTNDWVIMEDGTMYNETGDEVVGVEGANTGLKDNYNEGYNESFNNWLELANASLAAQNKPQISPPVSPGRVPKQGELFVDANGWTWSGNVVDRPGGKSVAWFIMETPFK